jgi:hypothetical protein
VTVALLPVLLLCVVVATLLAGARTPSPIQVCVVDDSLVIRIGRKDSFYALCRGMTIPLSCIQGVAVAPRRAVPATGMRLPGTGIPGVLRAGSYGTGASRDFWLVRQADQVLVVELEPGQSYRRLVLEVPDPHGLALQLRPMTGAYTGAFDR